MTSPILALRAAILAAAQGDAELAGLMGDGVRFYDEPPRAAEPVYAVFGDVRARDWSTGSDRGHEQDASIIVWGHEGGARSALLAANGWRRSSTAPRSRSTVTASSICAFSISTRDETRTMPPASACACVP